MHTLPDAWQAVSLGQYLLLQLPLPLENTRSRMAWQLACLSGRSPAACMRLDAGEWALANRRLAFLQTMISPDATLHWQHAGHTFAWLPDWGDLPLAAWVAFENTFLKPKQPLADLAAGNWTQLPQLLALLCTDAQGAYDMRALPAREKLLRHLPMPKAVGLLVSVSEGLSKLQSQYAALFASGKTDAPETPPPAPGPWEAYVQRWGWNALLADINGGRLTPADRQMWLGAPIHAVFQELLRQREYSEVVAAAERRTTTGA